MLNEKQLRKFEQSFLEIGKELDILKSRKKEFISVYDEINYSDVQKGVLSNIFGSVFEEEELDVSELEELPEEIESDDDIFEPQTSLQDTEEPFAEEPATASPIDSAAFEDESQTLAPLDTSEESKEAEPSETSIAETVPLEASATKAELPETSIAKTAPLEASAIETEPPETSIVEAAPLEAEKESLSDATEQVSTEPSVTSTAATSLAKMLAENAEHRAESVEVEAEIIEDDIDAIEGSLEAAPELAADTNIEGITLPPEFLENPAFKEQAQAAIAEPEAPEIAEEESVEKDIDISDLLEDAEALLLDEEDIVEDVEYTEQDLEEMYNSDTDLVKKADKYRTIRDFQKEDETIFFENLGTYSIYLQGPIVSILLNEELIDDSERLVDLVFEHVAPTVVQREIEKLLQKNVRLVDDTHIYNEDELRSKLLTFKQQIRRTSRTFLSRVLPVVAIVLFVSFYGYNFVAKPLKAWRHYERGYAYLEEKNNEQSEQEFLKAASMWIMPKYFFKYADLYQDQKSFIEQKIKYEQLIFGTNEDIREIVYQLFTENSLFTPIKVGDEYLVPYDLVNFSTDAFNAIVEYETKVNRDFSKARMYFNVWLNKQETDISMQIKFANFYIDWYDISNKMLHLDLARSVYDKIAVLDEQSEVSVLLRTRWAIRAEDMDYYNLVIKLISNEENTIDITENTLIAYLEIIQQKFKMQDIDYVANILDEIEKKFPQNINLPYLYSQYYQHVNQSELLISALERSIYRYETKPRLSIQEKYNYIDSYILLANIHLRYGKNLTLAKENIKNAQILFENNTHTHGIQDVVYLSRLYFIRSQIELLQGNIQAASEFIENNEYFDIESPQIEYHVALLHYLNKNWNKAANSFVKLKQNYSSRNAAVELTTTQHEILTLAIANAMFFNKNYVAAAVYYENLLQMLDTSNNAEINVLSINLDRDTTLINFKSKIAQIKNNLGASLYHISQKSINSDALSVEAFIELQESSTILQNLARDEDQVRKSYRDLSLLNVEALVSTKNTLPVNIYSDIPYTLDNTKYWEVAQASINPSESGASVQ